MLLLVPQEFRRGRPFDLTQLSSFVTSSNDELVRPLSETSTVEIHRNRGQENDALNQYLKPRNLRKTRNQSIRRGSPASRKESKEAISADIGNDPYLDKPVLRDPGEHGKAQAKSERVLRGRDDGHGLFGDRPVTVNHIRHADARHCTEDGVGDGGADDGDHRWQMVLDPGAPEHETRGSDDGWGNHAPKTGLWREVAAVPLGDELHSPVGERPTCHTADHGRNKILEITQIRAVSFEWKTWNFKRPGIVLTPG